MARRKNFSKNDFIGVIWLAVIGGPIFLFNWITENVGWMQVGFAVIVVVIVAVLVYRRLQNDRRKSLQQKYGNSTVVDKIMKSYIWEGQTEEQLLDSLGRPSAIDNHLLKTRYRQVWKYNPMGRGKFGLRVTLDDKRVVAWNQRS